MPDDSLGLESGKVRLADSKPEWAALFAAEKARLEAAIGPLMLGVEHFGSTAIPGLRAKPILDILVGLRRFEDGPALVAPLEALGYRYLGSDRIPGDHLFLYGEPTRHHVHALEHGGRLWTRQLRFRDALRADPALAAEYEALKLDLAARFANDRPAYLDGKQSFIDRISDA